MQKKPTFTESSKLLITSESTGVVWSRSYSAYLCSEQKWPSVAAGAQSANHSELRMYAWPYSIQCLRAD